MCTALFSHIIEEKQSRITIYFDAQFMHSLYPWSSFRSFLIYIYRSLGGDLFPLDPIRTYDF